jgi:hypothetical protein
MEPHTRDMPHYGQAVVNAVLPVGARRQRWFLNFGVGSTLLAGSSTDFGKLITEKTDKWAKVVNAELCTLSVGNRALRGELTYLAAMRTGELGILIQSLAACAIQAVGQNELQ